jgi:hypothetical protein
MSYRREYCSQDKYSCQVTSAGHAHTIQAEERLQFVYSAETFFAENLPHLSSCLMFIRRIMQTHLQSGVLYKRNAIKRY